MMTRVDVLRGSVDILRGGYYLDSTLPSTRRILQDAPDTVLFAHALSDKWDDMSRLGRKTARLRYRLKRGDDMRWREGAQGMLDYEKHRMTLMKVKLCRV